MLRGQTVFLMAGGPSLRGFDATVLRGRKVMAINSSARMVLDAGIADPMLWFMDSGWFKANRELIAAWPGLVFTASKHAKEAMPDKVRRVETIGRPGFFPARHDGTPGPADNKIRTSRSSGHAGVAISVMMEAWRVVLLGFDMKAAVDAVTGAARIHHHDEYGPRNAESSAKELQEFRDKFRGWNADAQALGTEIWNATPGSALTEFPMVDLAQVLAEEPV